MVCNHYVYVYRTNTIVRIRSDSCTKLHTTSTYAHLRHHPSIPLFLPSITPPPSLEMEKTTRLGSLQKLRTRVNNTDNEAQSGAEEVFTAPAILEWEREERRRSDEGDFSSA